MLFRVILPLVFIGLWSSAFLAAKVGVQYSTPFAMLLLRFMLVSLVFAAMLPFARAWRQRQQRPTGTVIAWTALVGITLHSVYLGSVFFALSLGLPAGIAALIVSLQPLLASGLAIFLFGEKLRAVQVGGMLAGLAGVVLVLLPKMGGGLPMPGLASVSFGLCAVTFGTLLQKRVGGKIDLLSGNLVQALAASAFLAVICLTVEAPQVSWQTPFILSLAWQVVMVSAGAYVILMVLIQRGTMASVSSLMFLVPPTTAVFAAIGFDEPLTALGLVGFCLTSAGVYLVTANSGPRGP
ncbi:MAG: DMT family transporter [Candidatus Puniceispirillaceae bacterium]